MKKQSNNKANVFTIDINQMIKQNIEESQKNNKPKRTPTPCIQIRTIILKKVSIANDFTQKKMELL